VIDLPRPTADALTAYQELHDQLSQWAPTVHRLVRERIDALAAAYGREHPGPTETTEQYVARVYARGQEPFPRGVSTYEDLNDNRGYDHIRVSYGRVYYGGHYPEWNADGSDYSTRWAEIDVPAWVITDPDGTDRYRAETSEIADRIRADEAELTAKVEAAMRPLLDDQKAEGATAPPGRP
jgi:hypothetical protein